MPEESEIKLNKQAESSIFKANVKYYFVNGILFLVILGITSYAYCYINHLNITTQIIWQILKSPKFLIPAIILIFVKDIFKYIIFGLGKDENRYLEEVEKENPTVDGAKDVIGGETIKQRFVFISLLFGVVVFMLLFLIKRLFSILTIISALGAYFYTAKHFHLAYVDFNNIILTKTFFLAFFINYFVLLSVKKLFIKEEKEEE